MDLKFVLSIFYINLIGGSVVLAHCPNGWMTFEGSCYLFTQQHSTFIDAEEHCNHYNGHLVHIQNTAENAFLKSWINIQQEPLYYIGLTDLSIEGRWEWYDTDILTNYTDWESGQPDGHSSQNCVLIYPHTGGSSFWVDENCSLKHKFICEKPEERECTNTEIIG